ncbi:MAG TPA: TIGR03435 family protein [Verrucomicrobiae bacterium]|jgi:uncharacterized protein (TIGR03435 family)
MPEPDNQLVAEFNAQRSETAFAALVRQHLNMVFSTALRQVGDAGAAEEIAQNVFVALAQSSGKLESHPTIAGWLYQTTLNKAREWVRSELRRRRREQTAADLNLARAEGDSLWSPLVPLLDEALLQLHETDRSAVVMRFMEGQTYQEVGSALDISEDAARKRVNRCLEQLTHFFQCRGFTTPALAVDAPLFALAMHVAPATLAGHATKTALATTHSASSTLTLKGALKLMAWTKAHTTLTAGIAALFVIGATTATVVTVKKIQAYEVENYLAHWDKMNLNDAPLPNVALLRPTRYQNQGDWILIGGTGPDDRAMRRDASFQEVLSTAYGFSPEQMVFNTRLPRGGFDMLLTTPSNSRETLRTEIKKQFGIVAHPETRDMDVLVMKDGNTNASGIKISDGGGPNILEDAGSIKLHGYTMADIAHLIGTLDHKPVVDETGLTNAYDVDASWDPKLQGKALQNKLDDIIRNQFGLQLTPDTQPVQVLVVEKAK